MRISRIRLSGCWCHLREDWRNEHGRHVGGTALARRSKSQTSVDDLDRDPDLGGDCSCEECSAIASESNDPGRGKRSNDELAECASWFAETIDLLPVRVFLALGQIGWRAMVDEARRREWYTGKLPKFGHGAQVGLAVGRLLLGSYHPSQQNTFTGRLTEEMFDAVFQAAREWLGD